MDPALWLREGLRGASSSHPSVGAVPAGRAGWGCEGLRLGVGGLCVLETPGNEGVCMQPSMAMGYCGEFGATGTRISAKEL